MPIRPIATGIALFALAIAIWLIVGGIRRHRWLSLLRIPPIVCCLALVALLVPTIFGLNGPHPFFNKPAPVSSGRLIFLRGNPDPSSGRSPLFGVSAQTGKTLWQHQLPSAAIRLLTDGQVLYTITYLTGATQVAAFNVTDGTPLWQCVLPNTYVNDSPILAGGALYLDTVSSPSNVQLLAIRAVDGKQLWSDPIDLANADGPWNIAATADILYIQPNGSTIQARRRADGKLLWTQSVNTGNVVVGGESMAAGPDAVYVCAEYGAVTALSPSSGAVLWTYGNHDFFHSAAFAGNTLYVTAQQSASVGESPETVYALDANTGTLRWQVATQSRNAGALTVGDGPIFVQADDGIHALRLTDGTVLWHSEPHNGWTFADTAPILGSVLYVSALETLPPETLTFFAPSKGQMYLYALNTADGSAYWGATVGPVFTIPEHFVI